MELFCTLHHQHIHGGSWCLPTLFQRDWWICELVRCPATPARLCLQPHRLQRPRGRDSCCFSACIPGFSAALQDPRRFLLQYCRLWDPCLLLLQWLCYLPLHTCYSGATGTDRGLTPAAAVHFCQAKPILLLMHSRATFRLLP